MKIIESRTLKKVLAILLCLGILFAVAGCGDEGEWVESEIIIVEDGDEDTQSGDSKGDGAVQNTSDKNASPDKLSNPNVTVCWSVTVDDHPEFTAINKAFEKKYGGKVTVVGDGKYDDRAARLTNLVQSKTQVDVVFIGHEDYPSYLTTKLVRPLDINQFDTTKAPYNNQDKSQIVTLRDKTYVISANFGVGAGVLCLYNKTMFENAGLETPLELYKKGQWNWNTFRDAARTLSQDTDGDGANDIRGFADYDINGLLCSNGTKLLNKNGDKYTVNLADERVRRAYQFYFDMYNIDKSINRDPWSWSEDMVQGKLAMVFQKPIYMLYWMQENAKFEYDFAPIPKGPDADKFYINESGNMQTFSMGATCKNPEGAYAYMKFYVEELMKNGFYNEKTANSKYTSDQEKRLAEYSKLTVNDYSPVGFGNLKMDARSLLWEIRGGKSVGATIEYWKNVLQQDIDIALMTN